MFQLCFPTEEKSVEREIVMHQSKVAFGGFELIPNVTKKTGHRTL